MLRDYLPCVASVLGVLTGLAACSGESAGGQGGEGAGDLGVGGGEGGATTSGASTTSSGSSTSGSSSASGGGAPAGSSGTASSSGAGGADCVDTGLGEPDNGTEATAHRITGSCKDGDVGKVYGVLDGPDDVDWFVYTGQDKYNCKVNPTHGVEADAGQLRLCVFAECIEAEVEVSCPTEAQPEVSPAGRQGCCASKTFELGLNCKGTTADDANIYIRVDDPTGEAICPSYTVSYHY